MVRLSFLSKCAGVFVGAFMLLQIFSACASQDSARLPGEGRILGPFDNAGEAIRAFEQASPGDHIVIKDGTYRDFDGNFGKRNGALDNSIVIRAQTPGGVTLTGKSRIHINDSSHVTIQGFIFTDGFYGTGTGNAAILASGDNSSYIRVTDIFMDNYNSPNPPDDVRWVRLFGQHNEIDNSSFINKTSRGVTVELCRSNGVSQPNFGRIHHNYFGFSTPVLDDTGREMNGLETVRIGTSENSQFDASSVVEYNFFEELDGEIEIISNKSGSNIYRGNVLYNSNGALALRHGNSCIVENNFFINAGERARSGMAGVRVMDKNHIIRNNYFENLNTNRRSAVSLEYAVVNSPLNRYWPVIDTVIENNTFVNNRMAISTGPTGSISSDQTIPPEGTAARNNLIVSNTNDLQITYRADTNAAIAFTNNLAFGQNLRLVGHGNPPAHTAGTPDGIRIADPQISRNQSYWYPLYMPADAFKEFGMQMREDMRMITREETGASFAKGGIVR